MNRRLKWLFGLLAFLLAIGGTAGAAVAAPTTPASVPGAVRVTLAAPAGVPANLILDGAADQVVAKPPVGIKVVATLALAAGSYAVRLPSVQFNGQLYVGVADKTTLTVAANKTVNVAGVYLPAIAARNLHVVKVQSASVALAWDPPTLLKRTTYQVRRSAGAIPVTKVTQGTAVPVTGTTAADTGLSAGTKYSYALFTKVGPLWTGPVTLVAGTASATPGAANYVANPSTVFLSAGQIKSASGTGSGLEVTLAAGTPAPLIGAAVIVPRSDSLPGGYVGVTTAVSADGSTIELRPAGLSAALDYFDLEVPDLSTLANGPATSTATPATPATKSAKAKAALEPAAAVECGGVGGSTEVTFSPSVDIGGYFNARVDKYNVLGKDIPQGASLNALIAVTVTGDLKIKTDAELSCELHLPHLFKVFPSEIPIALDLGPLAEVSIGGGTEVTHHIHVTGGVQFSGSFGLLSGASFAGNRILQATPSTPEVEKNGSIEAKVGGQLTVGPGVGTEKAGVIAGIGGEVDPVDAKFEAVWSPDDPRFDLCTETSIGFSAALNLTAKAFLDSWEVSKTVTLDALQGTAQYAGSPWYRPSGCDKEPEDLTVGTSASDAVVGVAYHGSLDATGGTGPYSWTLTGASAGNPFTLAPDGRLSGTPSAGGRVTLQVSVTDSTGASGTGTVEITVFPPLPPINGGAPTGGAASVPVSCAGQCANAWGDPHFVSYDGARFDLQLAGELVLERSTTDDLEVQVRQQPWNGSPFVAVNTAVAARVAGHRVGLYVTGSGLDVRIDGTLSTIDTTGTDLPGGGHVALDTNTRRVTLTWPDGSLLLADYTPGAPTAGYISLILGTPPARAGHVTGLLGNDDGQPANDLVARDGTTVAYPVSSTDALLHTFGDSWRISQKESLFDYDAGQSAATFTDTSFPHNILTAADLPASTRTTAGTICADTGVTDAATLNACMLDVAITGDPAFAGPAATAQAASAATVVNSGSGAVAASAPGDPWTDPAGASGSAVLTYGHLGCGSLDANGLCVGGSWANLPGARWIWTSQIAGAQQVVTFTKHVTLTSAQATHTYVLTALADNSATYTITSGGTIVATGSVGGFSSPTPSAPLSLQAGDNVVTFTVTNAGAGSSNNPAGLAWALTPLS